MPTHPLELTYLATFPLKAAQAAPLTTAHAGRDGFQGDRRWLLSTPDGAPVMLKTHPTLARLRIRSDAERLVFSAEGLEDLGMVPPTGDARIEVSVKKDRIQAAPAGPEADEWFSRMLGTPVRLVYMPDDTTRPAKGDPGASIGFAGTAPYLLTCEASRSVLEDIVPEAAGLARCRTNLAVSGGEPWQEDNWRVLRIGGAVFETIGPCPRCPNMNIDPETGAVGSEPLRTLMEMRNVGGQAMFSLFMGVREPGTVSLGDPVEVLG